MLKANVARLCYSLVLDVSERYSSLSELDEIMLKNMICYCFSTQIMLFCVILFTQLTNERGTPIGLTYWQKMQRSQTPAILGQQPSIFGRI